MEKTRFRIVAVVAVAMFCAAASAAPRIGTVDMMLLVRSHSSYDTNKELLQGMEKDLRSRLETMKEALDEIQEEARKLADELKNPMLAAAAKEEAEKKIVAAQRRFVQQQGRMREESVEGQKKIADTEAMLLKSQAGDLKKRIAAFARKNGYDLIVDSAAALFAADDMDVTDAVLKEMGVDPKQARSRERKESEK